MKHYRETKAVREVIERELVEVTCDLCDTQLDPFAEERELQPGDEQHTIVIEHTVTLVEAGSGRLVTRSLELDICPPCFRGRVLVDIDAARAGRGLAPLTYSDKRW